MNNLFLTGRLRAKILLPLALLATVETLSKPITADEKVGQKEALTALHAQLQGLSSLIALTTTHEGTSSKRTTVTAEMLEELTRRIALIEKGNEINERTEELHALATQLNQLIDELKKTLEHHSQHLPLDLQGPRPMVSGFVDIYYGINFQKPSSRVNKFRNFDVYSNQISLNLAKVKVEQIAGPVGFRFEAAVGPTADMVHTIDGKVDETFKYIHQAYINIIVPGTGGLVVDAGKFTTLEGAEVIETNGNWNYSRSLLFAWAIPYFHTGIRMTYPLKNDLTVMGMVANGWNRIVDNNDAKTFGAQVAWTPVTGLNVTQSWISGAEQPGNNTDQRTVWDSIIAWQISEQSAVNINYDYGYETIQNTRATWTGLSGMFRYTVDANVALAVRGEWFDDRNGVQTGVEQDLREVTLTGEWKIDKHLLLRTEFRHDWSSAHVFDGEGSEGSTTRQTTFMMGAIFDF